MHDIDVDPETVLRALGHPSRQKIIEWVTDEPHSVSWLARQLGVTNAAVLQHLQVLEAAGLVETKKSGRKRICVLAGEGFRELDEWLNDRRQIIDEWAEGLSEYILVD